MRYCISNASTALFDHCSSIFETRQSTVASYPHSTLSPWPLSSESSAIPAPSVAEPLLLVKTLQSQEILKQDDAVSPHLSGSDDRSRDHRSPCFICSLFFSEDSRNSPSKFSLFFIIFLVLTGFVCVSSIIRRLVCSFSDLLLSFFWI